MCSSRLYSRPCNRWMFYVDGQLYCRDDYHKKRGIKCTRCSKFVEGEAISAAEFRFHHTCFRCFVCRIVFPTGFEICYDGEHLIWHSHYREELQPDQEEKKSPAPTLGIDSKAQSVQGKKLEAL